MGNYYRRAQTARVSSTTIGMFKNYRFICKKINHIEKKNSKADSANKPRWKKKERKLAKHFNGTPFWFSEADMQIKMKIEELKHIREHDANLY